MTDFLQLPDLAGITPGGSVMFANDEAFAEATNLIKPGAPRHDPTAFGPRGKVYDGWETRRRRTPGSDFVVLRLNAPAIVRGVDIDTSFFRGSYPPAAHVRLTIHPDGGVARFRVFGEVDPRLHGEPAQRWLGLLPPQVAEGVDRAEFFT